MISTKYGEELLSECTFNGNLENIYPRIDTEPQLGYGVVQAFSEGSDAPFKALMSATKASLAHTKSLSERIFVNHFAFAIPVVLIDVPLLSVSLVSETNEIQIREIPKANVLWKQLVGDRSRIGIYIVTKKEFPAFLERCFASARWWTSIDREALARIDAGMRAASNPTVPREE